MTPLTPEEMRVFIAEKCGWTRYMTPPNPDFFYPPALRGCRELYRAQRIPDFCADLNAMAEARKVLTEEQRRSYGDHLTNIVESPFGYGFHLYTKYPWSGDDVFALVNSTALQQATAFCKVFGK